MGLKIAAMMGVAMAVMLGGFYWYYQDSQARMATLRENNAQLEVAAQIANESLDTMRSDFARVSSLNTELQKDLQKAEQYSDELRGKLAKLDLAVEALKDSKSLEGKMNGATANVWRDFMRDSGNTNEYDLPNWLQSSRERSRNGNESGEDNSTKSSSTETTTTN